MNSFWPTWKTNKLFTILLAAVMVLFCLIFVMMAFSGAKSYYYIGKSTETPRTITIGGQGKVTVIPDVAVVTMGYSVEKKTVAEAQKDNTGKMNALIAKVKELGIEAKDIKTTSYNVYPQYNYDDGKQTLRGYQVDQYVEVKIRNNDKISQILDLVGTLGLNQVGNLNFQVDDPEQYQQEARIEALKNAKLKAKDLADIMGVSLGKIISFSEDGSYNPPTPMYARDALGIGGAAESVSVESGSQEMIVNASVTYELN